MSRNLLIVLMIAILLSSVCFPPSALADTRPPILAQNCIVSLTYRGRHLIANPHGCNVTIISDAGQFHSFGEEVTLPDNVTRLWTTDAVWESWFYLPRPWVPALIDDIWGVGLSPRVKLARVNVDHLEIQLTGPACTPTDNLIVGFGLRPAIIIPINTTTFEVMLPADLAAGEIILVYTGNDQLAYDISWEWEYQPAPTAQPPHIEMIDISPTLAGRAFEVTMWVGPLDNPLVNGLMQIETNWSDDVQYARIQHQPTTIRVQSPAQAGKYQLEVSLLHYYFDEEGMHFLTLDAETINLLVLPCPTYLPLCMR